jgi:hypothetical protein
MSTKQEIENFQLQRAEEVRRLYYQFARTRRDVRNTLTPRRVIRRHPDLAVLAATLAGFWLAPHVGRPAPRKQSRGRSGPLGLLSSFFTSRHPTHEEEEKKPQPHEKPPHSWAQILIRAALPIVLRELKSNGSLLTWIENTLRKTSEHFRKNGHTPTEPSAAASGPDMAADRSIHPE